MLSVPWWQHGHTWLLCWIKASAQHPAVLSSSQSYLVIVPCKKCFPKKYKDNTPISNSFMHWTLLVLSTWEVALKWSHSLSQPGGHPTATKGFNADTVSSCMGLSAVLKFSFLKHLLQLSSAFACTHVFRHYMFTPIEWFHVCLLLTFHITNISKRIHKNCFVPISLSILILGCHFDGFIIDQLLAARRYFIQFLCYTGKPSSGSKLMGVCVIHFIV